MTDTTPAAPDRGALAITLAAAYTTTWQAWEASRPFGGDLEVCADVARDNAGRAIRHAENAGHVTVERDLETRRIIAVRPVEPK